MKAFPTPLLALLLTGCASGPWMAQGPGTVANSCTDELRMSASVRSIDGLSRQTRQTVCSGETAKDSVASETFDRDRRVLAQDVQYRDGDTSVVERRVHAPGYVERAYAHETTGTFFGFRSFVRIGGR